MITVLPLTDGLPTWQVTRLKGPERRRLKFLRIDRDNRPKKASRIMVANKKKRIYR